MRNISYLTSIVWGAFLLHLGAIITKDILTINYKCDFNYLYFGNSLDEWINIPILLNIFSIVVLLRMKTKRYEERTNNILHGSIFGVHSAYSYFLVKKLPTYTMLICSIGPTAIALDILFYIVSKCTI